MKRIAVLGSTGSIGTQTVEVVTAMGDEFSVEALSAKSNGGLLLEQARTLGAVRACLADEEAAARFSGEFAGAGIDLLAGPGGLVSLAAEGSWDLVLNAVVGSAGLPVTLAVLDSGADLALANKESLVAGGSLVTRAAGRSDSLLIPVDSEHSAIFQCLNGERSEDARRIILTASGGPFRGHTIEELRRVTVEEALVHPTWNMGRKVTVDSATLMNKGLEVLEAYHLFGVALEDIEVVVHPQSVVHSMVEMRDGSVLAQMGVPDMRTPIQYALTYPGRKPANVPLLDIVEYGELTFENVDPGRFPCLGVAYEAGREGGTYPAAMNAANEEAVSAFLEGRLGFMDIYSVISGVLEAHDGAGGETLEDVLEAESRARELARVEIESLERRN